jgi:TRAP-type C4-dicarboxylate transport system substrate-binding protein
VKEGTVDIVWTGMGYSPDRFPALDVFELPFMATPRAGSSQALWEYVRLSDRAQAELDGVRLLAIHQHEAPQLHMRAKPVATLEDLQGLKIATSAAVGRKLLAALGASPMQVSGADLSAALSSGTADGALLPWENALAVQESLRYHSETDPRSPWLYANVFVLAMNSAAYKSLSEDLRKVIDANSGLETAAWLGRVFRASADDARRQAVARGDAVNVLPADELKRWHKAAQAVVDDWMKDLGRLGLNGKPILEAAREARAEYDPVK